jgi:TolB-like protein/DNA-binding winged helix-turn-helix (wHTH) protein/Tfp pilus assembly protein PilF
MRSAREGERFARWLDFEFDLCTLRLRKRGIRLRMEQKPARLLARLLEQPGEVVTRDELVSLLWPGEQHGEFDQRLNKAVHKVRCALGDNPADPRFIETLSRYGHRFIADVEFAGRNGRSVPESATIDAKQNEVLPLIPPVEAVATGEEAPEPRSAVAAPPFLPIAPARRPISLIPWGLAALALTIVTVLGVQFRLMRRTKPHSETISSLAVLPLRNLSPDPGQDYFADGITEELITDLAQSLPIRVISRTSVMRYRHTSEPVNQIARDLGVQAIVEGAVERSGDRVRVTIQLIDASEDRHLWAKTYDRRVEDILSVEGELSQEISSQVGVALDSKRRSKLANSHPVDPKVYELCLLGRYFWNKRTAADLKKSLEYYQEAVQRDPNYAPAFVGLASGYELLPMYGSVNIDENFEKARAAANRAIELDETLAGAHLAMAFLALNHWQTESKESKREFDRSLELNPNDATAHIWFAYYFLFSGQINDAVAEAEHARQLDPLSPIVNADEGHFLYIAGRRDEAASRLRQAIELAPEFGLPHETLAWIDLEEGRDSDALKEANRGLDLDSNNPRIIGEAGYVLAKTGHTIEARRLLAHLDELARHDSSFPIYPALIFIGLGERSRAVDVLLEAEKSDNQHWSKAALIQWPIFDQLKSDPRYQKLLLRAR